MCCPASTVILGWLWEQGSIRPTSHRINALLACEQPATIKGLRSYIGCYKTISRSLPFYADILDPLEQVCGSRESGEKIAWSDELCEAFNRSKSHLKKVCPVILPKPSDQLHIVTDAAVRSAGIASALYVVRRGKPILAGYFNAKRKGSQNSWLPCEAEALCIGVSGNHFGPYIKQSEHQTKIYTDSKPCVQAYNKMKRGEYSNSSRMQTFLTMVANLRVEVIHISGKDNIFSDFASRNPVTCENPDNCQICSFISKLESSVIGQLTVNDILSGKSSIPYNSRSSWLNIQKSCKDLMKVKEYLQEGLTPSGKRKGVKDILRYLNCVSLSTSPSDGLLVVKKNEIFKKTAQRTVIPRNFAKGLLTSLHLTLNHPSIYQMEKVLERSFFILDMHATVSEVVNNCHACASLKNVPSHLTKQSTSIDIDRIGSLFSADVMKDNGQFIMIIRENISSFTVGMIIPNEKAESLQDSITTLMCSLRSAISPSTTIRTDPASGLRSLINNQTLRSLKMSIELGDPKNPNKNPIAEKAIEELRSELRHLQPRGGKISTPILARGLLNLNSRIRENKLSAFEVWTQREMLTGDQLTIKDENLIKEKVNQRLSNHSSSEKYKSRGKTEEIKPNIKVGDIVYLWLDRSKSKSRDRYLVIQLDDDGHVQVQKFTGNQLRSRKYRVKPSDVYSVQSFSSVLPQSETKSHIPVFSKQFHRRRSLPIQPRPVSDDSYEYDDEVPLSSLIFEGNNSEQIPVEQETPAVDNLPIINQQGNRPARDRRAPDRLQVGRPTRNCRQPKYLEDYVLANDTALPSSSEDELESNSD